MATIDNNPGAGLTVDKWFYQPVGRWVEKSAGRLAVRFDAVPPAVISKRIIEMRGRSEGFESVPYELNPFSSLFDSEWRNGSATLAGLESLIRQTQFVPIDVHLFRCLIHFLLQVEIRSSISECTI